MNTQHQQPGSSLYPTEPQTRATVDRLLYFDIGTLYKSLADVVYPVFRGLDSEYDPEKVKVLGEKVAFVNDFLESNKYVAGDQMTLADISLYSSLGFFEVIDFDLSPSPNVVSWMGRMATEIEDDENVNVKPNQEFKVWFEAKRADVASVLANV